MAKTLSRKQIKKIADKAKFVLVAGILHRVTRRHYHQDMDDDNLVLELRSMAGFERDIYLSYLNLRLAEIDKGKIFSSFADSVSGCQWTDRSRQTFEFFELESIEL